MKHSLYIVLLSVLMSSCTNTVDSSHAAECKELKRRIVFNAATGNNTQATQQRGELNRLNKNYNSQGC